MNNRVKYLLIIFIVAFLLPGCSNSGSGADIVATTLPVYELTAKICQNTPLVVQRLVTENVSCLHDYSLQVDQMRLLEDARVVVISGAGLESFLEDALSSADQILDSSSGVHIHSSGEEHGHSAHAHSHTHATDPHIWLSSDNVMIMAQNIYAGLCKSFPDYASEFQHNFKTLEDELIKLHAYGEEMLSNLSCREIITFHDGFSYFAECYDLKILRSVEEESGSEASAAALKELILLVEKLRLPAIFTEINGSTSAASVICAETGTRIYALDMGMSGDSFITAMYRNIDTIKEALG